MFKIVSIQNASNLSSKQAWSAWKVDMAVMAIPVHMTQRVKPKHSLTLYIYIQFAIYSGDSVEFKCMEVWKYN